jgi:hypothetical protein
MMLNSGSEIGVAFDADKKCSNTLTENPAKVLYTEGDCIGWQRNNPPRIWIWTVLPFIDEGFSVALPPQPGIRCIVVKDAAAGSIKILDRTARSVFGGECNF